MERKNPSKQKWTNREYHVKHNKHVYNKYIDMYCPTNNIPELQFLGPHNTPHDVRGLDKHYKMRFYPKICHVTCAI